MAVVVEGGGERNNSRSVALKASEAQGPLNRCQWRCWAGLNRELLALIFVRIKPVESMVQTVPLVCQPWREAVAGPDCWAHIDVEEWCRRVAKVGSIDPVVRRLIRRSRGMLRTLSAYEIGESAFFYACSSGRFLRVLKMPMSAVTDQMVEKQAPALSVLTVLDISYCLKITSKGVEVIGNCCKSLLEFRRNMPPPNLMVCQENKPDEAEAMAVADTMHSIEHLELAYGRFSDNGLDAILSKCGALRVLDIRGCWNCEVEGRTESKCDLIQSVRYPWEIDNIDLEASDDEGDDDKDGDDEDASDASEDDNADSLNDSDNDFNK